MNCITISAVVQFVFLLLASQLMMNMNMAYPERRLLFQSAIIACRDFLIIVRRPVFLDCLSQGDQWAARVTVA